MTIAPAVADVPKQPRIVGDWQRIAGDPDLGDLTTPSSSRWTSASGRPPTEPGSSGRASAERRSRATRASSTDGRAPTHRPGLDADGHRHARGYRGGRGRGRPAGALRLQGRWPLRDVLRRLGRHLLGGERGRQNLRAPAGRGRQVRPLRRLVRQSDRPVVRRPTSHRPRATSHEPRTTNHGIFRQPARPDGAPQRRSLALLYTAHPNNHGADYCRTSRDLRAWSEPRIVAAAGRRRMGRTPPNVPSWPSRTPATSTSSGPSITALTPKPASTTCATRSISAWTTTSAISSARCPSPRRRYCVTEAAGTSPRSCRA